MKSENSLNLVRYWQPISFLFVIRNQEKSKQSEKHNLKQFPQLIHDHELWNFFK